MKARSFFALAGWAAVGLAVWYAARGGARDREVAPEAAEPCGPDGVAPLPVAPDPSALALPPHTSARPGHLPGLRPVRSRPSPKARHDDYDPAPFFFEQHNPLGGSRLVAWTGDLDRQRDALATLIHILAPRVEVLTKVMRDEASDERVADHWLRFYGIAPAPALLEAMGRCEAFVFRDSRTQICVRSPWTLEYVVLDHDGCLYVYSDAPRFRACLEALGFEWRIEALISSRAHWRQLPPEGPAQQHQFVRLLRLSPLRAPHEPTPAHEVH